MPGGGGEVKGGDELTVIDVEGSGLDRGLMHGEQLRELIGQAMERWRKSVVDQRGMPSADFARLFLASTDYARVIGEHSPDLAEEVRGIAIGSGQDAHEILAFNLLDEEWWFEPEAVDTGCSVVATRIVPHDGEEPATLLAQNMDLPLALDQSQALLRIRQPDAPEQIVLTAAGMIGLTGVNAAGLGICVNTLLSLRRSKSGLPVAFAFREALKRSDAASAASFLRSIPHASGQHYALADPSRTIGLECSASGCAEGPEGLELIHTNHPLWSQDLDEKREPTVHWSARMQRSAHRLQALADGAEQVRTDASAAGLLARADIGLCVVPSPENQSTTFGSVEYVLTTPPRVRVALGRPDLVTWRDVPWTSAPSIVGAT